jgi:DNA-directed RNA polymerase subunit RPC12/RpoP
MQNKPSLFLGILGYKCPNCRVGKLFLQKGIFPLKNMLKMNINCPHCNQKLKGESNNGPGINYALTTILLFLNILWYYPIFGMSYKDNSIFYFLGTSTAVVILMQPILMRLSRVIYLYILLAFTE